MLHFSFVLVYELHTTLIVYNKRNAACILTF